MRNTMDTRRFTTSDACWLGAVGRRQLAGLAIDVRGEGLLIDTIRREVLADGARLARAEGARLARAEGAEVVVGVLSEIAWPDPTVEVPGAEGFAVWRDIRGVVYVVGADSRGALYGYLALGRFDIASLGLSPVVETPSCALRMVDQWDNMTCHAVMGEVERGYAGRSILFRDGEIAPDRGRIRDYARLLASGGINAISLNNVNVHRVETDLVSARIDIVAELAAIFREYGVTCYISVNFASPKVATPTDGLPALQTADPLAPEVTRWWGTVANRLFSAVPDFGGFVVKADSEGEPGPFAYGRTHADGANMLARALALHGGRVLWRCFVYDCFQDWRDRTTDRARAAYDHFMPSDGAFDDNVALQIKFGPMDFQVREPISPLIGALNRTNVVVEFQITQEYTGQQKHLFYLGTQWSEVLGTTADDDGSTVSRVVTRAGCGMTAVSNVGDSWWWTGNPLAQLNLYAYTRLAWNPELDPRAIADEWIDASYGPIESRSWLLDVLLSSREVYERYTAPLGVGFMVRPGTHYGPMVDGYEYDRWGTYHFADRDGVGVDRTVATGSGFAGLFPREIAERYENIESCPDEELLFFHHVPYSHTLSSGRSVVQHIYDTHFESVDQVESWAEEWPRRSEGLPDGVREAVSMLLVEQLRCAREWRDHVVTYFWRHSGIPDDQRRQIYP